MLYCLLLFFPRSDYNIACGPSTLNEQLLAGGLLWKGNGLLLPPQLERFYCHYIVLWSLLKEQ